MLPGKGLRGGPFVTEDEILTMADVAAEEASIETEERELIHSIFEFGDTVVREVMVPRPDMVAVDADATVDEAIRIAIAAGKSRLPAYNETTDDIIGLVFLKDLVTRSGSGEGNEPVRQMLRPAHFVPESKRVAELLREMQTEKFHMAIVIDEHGGTAGLVTMEDLLEEIVGEITDEYDVDEPQVERLPGGALRVPGPHADRRGERAARRGAARRASGTRWAGSCSTRSATCPSRASARASNGLEFCAERVQGRRIVSVRITRSPPPSTRVERWPTGRRRAVTGVTCRRSSGRASCRSSAGPTSGSRRSSTSSSGRKVSIVSSRPQTTRTQVRGVRTTDETQIVFLDTPGIHKPRTLLGERTNSRALTTLGEVDVVCFLIDASEPIGRGDRFIAELVAQVRTPTVLVVNKVDRAEPQAHRRAPRGRVGGAGRARGVRAALGAHRRGRRRAGRRARGADARGPALLPRRRRERSARGGARRRAAAREAARRDPRRAARTRSWSPTEEIEERTTKDGPAARVAPGHPRRARLADGAS